MKKLVLSNKILYIESIEPGAGYIFGAEYCCNIETPGKTALIDEIGLPLELAQGTKPYCELERLLGDEGLYHPVPVGKYSQKPETKNSIQRFNLIVRYLTKYMPSFDNATMLDLGCHYGYLGFSLEALGFTVTAIEKLHRSVCICRLIKDVLASRINFRWCRAEDIIEEGQDYDVVMAMNMLHYVFDGKARVFLEHFFNRLGAITKKYCILSYPVNNPRWTIPHEGDVFEDICYLGGFRSVECVGYPEGSYPIWIASK